MHYQIKRKHSLIKYQPFTQKRAIEQRIQETTEAKAICSKTSVPIHGLSGTDTLLDQFHKGISLTPHQLEAILDLIDAGNRIKRFMKKTYR